VPWSGRAGFARTSVCAEQPRPRWGRPLTNPPPSRAPLRASARTS
jgi:hypothetical protein